jgi:hypothetical protein
MNWSARIVGLDVDDFRPNHFSLGFPSFLILRRPGVATDARVRNRKMLLPGGENPKRETREWNHHKARIKHRRG